MTIPAPSVYFVLSLGALSGGVVKGITGFGNAIINLLVWVAFTAAGVDAGPLRLAVLADTIGCLVCGIPLIVMTSAHKTADWRLVFAFVLFTSSGAPLGAMLLTQLNPRWVELVMALVLLLVICLHVKLHETLAAAYRRYRGKHRTAAHDPLGTEQNVAEGSSGSSGSQVPTVVADVEKPCTTLCSAAQDTSAPMHMPCERQPLLTAAAVLDSSRDPTYGDLTTPCTSCDLVAVDVRGDGNNAAREVETTASIPAKHAGNGCCGGSDSSCEGDDASGPAGTKAPQATDPSLASASASVSASETVILITACCTATSGDATAVANATGKEPVKADGPCSGSNHSNACTSGCAWGAKPKGAACSCAHGTADTQPLLDNGASASDAVPLSSSAGLKSAETHAGGGACKARSGMWARCRAWLKRQDWLEMRRILLIGSVAGFASGVMGGMTGIGGPPIMYMYEKLKVSKEVVRGTNAVNNVLQARLVTYIIMGVFQREEVPLYLITSLVGLVGVGVGNCLAGRLDQKGFSRVLVALMSICCVLLFVSAAGVKGHAA